MKFKHALPLSESVITIAPDASLPAAWRRMQEHHVRHLVVSQKDDIVGIVADRDIMVKGLNSQTLVPDQTLHVADVMVRLSGTLTEVTDLRGALNAMHDHKVSGLPLVKQGKLAGIVTETDLLAVLTHVLAKSDSPKATLTASSMAVLSNPLLQNLFDLLAQAGI